MKAAFRSTSPSASPSPTEFSKMPNPEERSSSHPSSISLPRSPQSCPSTLSSPTSHLSLSPSLSPQTSQPSLKRQRSSQWDSTTSVSSSSDEASDVDDRPHPSSRTRVSPLSIGFGSVTMKDAHGLPPFSLSASSAFLPLPASPAALSPSTSVVRIAAHLPGVVLSGAATAAGPSIPPLHPIALHPTVRFAYPSPISVPVMSFPPQSPYLYGPSPSGSFIPHHTHVVPLSQSPSVSAGATAAFAPFTPTAFYPVHSPMMGGGYGSMPGSSPPSSPFPASLPPWPTEARAAARDGLRFLVHFPDDSSHGAQGGLYQPGKPSLLCIHLVDPDGREEEVRLPVKIALKPTVKESATVRRFDELCLHPRAFYCDSTDLGMEEARWQTAASVPDPAFLLLRQDWKGAVAVVHVPRWGRQQRETVRVSPLHILPVQDGTLAHTQTRGRGKTEAQRKETAQLYLSMIVDAYYELRCHSGYSIARLQMRHYKGGSESARVDLRFSGLEADTRVQDAISVIECLSGVDAGKARRQAKLTAGHEAWRMAQRKDAGKREGQEEKEAAEQREEGEGRRVTVVRERKGGDGGAVKVIGKGEEEAVGLLGALAQSAV